MMSSTICIAPLLAALIASQSFEKNVDSYWVTKNPTQEILFNKFWPIRSEIDKFLPEELRSKSSRVVEEVNTFLKENDFDIQLEKMDNTRAFYVASILNIALNWIEKGKADSVYHYDSGKFYSAVKMSKNGDWRVYGSALSDCDKILEIKAKNGDKVYMKMAEKSLSGFDLMTEVFELQNCLSKLRTDNSYSKILFPKVKINQKEDIGWLKKLEMRFNGCEDYYEIGQALQQTKLDMDENGAVIQTAVAIGWSRSTVCFKDVKPVFEIDKPFYLWVMRPGMSIPLIASYVDESSWEEKRIA